MVERRKDSGCFRWFGNFDGKFGDLCVYFCNGGTIGGCIFFGMEGVDRFGGWYFEGKVAFEDCCFE